MTNPGDAVPYYGDAIVRRQDDLKRALREQGAARSLAASTIGAGGLTVKDGGSITIEGTGALNVGSGALNSAGSITAATNITAGGTVQGATVNSTGNVNAAAGSVTGLNVLGTSIFAANAGNINGNITTARTTLWARNSDGYIGNTLSSIRFKTDVTDSGIDPLAVLGINVKHYRYIAEVRKRDDPTYEGYVGPDYHVALEVGAIAEDLHAAGLWEFVVYEREEDGSPRLNSNGEVIPISIHYELWGLAAQVATQHVWAEHLKLAEKQAEDRADIDRILEHLGI